MKQYTIVYEDLSGNAQVYIARADGVDQALCVFERDPDAPEFNDILHVVPHPVPRITVVLNGDMVEEAYSDVEVELLHVYSDREDVDRAIENGDPVMPASERFETAKRKIALAYPFAKVDVAHDADLIDFDFGFIADKGRVKRFTDAVAEELES